MLKGKKKQIVCFVIELLRAVALDWAVCKLILGKNSAYKFNQTNPWLSLIAVFCGYLFNMFPNLVVNA
jgi:hypothetical protein